jgi:UDP-glucose 4-epimerase
MGEATTSNVGDRAGRPWRVLLTGMGGGLGTTVARLLESHPQVEAVAGLDIGPPRRQMSRSEFHRVDPRNRARTVEVVHAFRPTAVLHLGIYEPNARSTPKAAVERTAAGTIAVLGAAAACGTVERFVMRSGIEIYGRGRGVATRPDESVEPAPTSEFGRSLHHAERVARATADSAGITLSSLRFAPLAGPHLASPLGRYLRLPAVPLSLGGLPFCLLHRDDAATALVRALEVGHDGPINVVGSGAVNAWQAARLGGRVPVPVAGPAWLFATRVTELAGSPLPGHVRELLVRGRVADGRRQHEILGIRPAHTTTDVVKHLYEWASVAYIDQSEDRAA